MFRQQSFLAGVLRADRSKILERVVHGNESISHVLMLSDNNVINIGVSQAAEIFNGLCHRNLPL